MGPPSDTGDPVANQDHSTQDALKNLSISEQVTPIKVGNGEQEKASKITPPNLSDDDDLADFGDSSDSEGSQAGSKETPLFEHRNPKTGVFDGHVYLKNLSKTAELFGTRIEILRSMLSSEKDDYGVQAFAKELWEKCLKAKQAKMKEGGKQKERGGGFDKIIKEVYDDKDTFSDPTDEDKARWDEISWYAYTVFRYHRKLRHTAHGLFAKMDHLDDKTIMNLCLLFTRWNIKLIENPQAMQNMRNQAKSERMRATRRAKAQQRKASEVARLPAAVRRKREETEKEKRKEARKEKAGGTKPDGDSKSGSAPKSKPPTGTRSKQRKRTTKFSANDAKDVTEAAEKRNKEYMLKVAELFENAKKAKDALEQNGFDGDAALEYMSDSEILDAFLDDQKQWMKEHEEWANKQKEKAARPLASHLAELQNDPARHRIFRLIRGFLRNAANDFYSDFEFADVDNLKEAALKVFKASEEATHELATAFAGAELFEPTNEETERRNADGLELEVAGDVAITEALIAKSAEKEDKDDEKEEQATKDSDVQLIDVPIATEADKVKARKWNQTLNSEVFQRDNLKEACARIGISDIRFKNLLLQNPNISLRWWQVIAIAWALDKDGLVADAIGLGKTFQYGGTILQEINEFNEVCALIDETNAKSKALNKNLPKDKQIPLKPYPPARPALVVVLPQLLYQTCSELARFSSQFRVKIYGSKAVNLRKYPRVSDISHDSDLAKTTDLRNISTVVVTTFNFLERNNGPKKFMRWKRWYDANNRRAGSDEDMEIDLHRTFHLPDDLSEFYPSDDIMKEFPDSFRGVFRRHILDEVQCSLRNASKHWSTIYINRSKENPCRISLFSGSPAPRGLRDFYSYLLLCHDPALEQEVHTRIKGTDAHGDWVYPHMNPYTLPDSHPFTKFRATPTCFRFFIIESKDENLTEVDKGLLAQKCLESWVLRRDYSCACPIGSENTIASNMPHVSRLVIEKSFKPSVRTYWNRITKPFASKMVILQTNTQNGTEEPIPNARTLRAYQIINAFPFLGALHKEEEIITEKGTKSTTDKDSWFNVESKIYQATPAPSKDGRRIRWLLNKCRDTGCPILQPEVNYQTLGKKELISLLCNLCPKIAMTLALLSDYLILRKQKMLVWFNYPEVQELVEEILNIVGFKAPAMRSMYRNTSLSERSEMQEQLNARDGSLELLLLSMKVSGIGLNYQQNCSRAIIFDSCDSFIEEEQVIGRIWRMGQLMDCLIFNIMVTDTSDTKALQKQLVGSLAGTATMMSMADNNLDNSENSPLYDDYKSNWLSGYFTDDNEQLFHLGKMSGYKKMLAKRKELKEKRWWPTAMSADMVLLQLVSANRFTRVRIDTGVEGQSDLVKLFAKEMAEREAKAAAAEEAEKNAAEEAEKKGTEKAKTKTKDPSTKSNAASTPNDTPGDIVQQSATKSTKRNRKRKDRAGSEGDGSTDPAKVSSPTPDTRREQKKPKLDPPTDDDDDMKMGYSSGWEADEPGEDGGGTADDVHFPKIYTPLGYHKLDRKAKAENTSSIKKYGKKWSIPKMINYQAPKKKDIEDGDDAPDHKLKSRTRRTYGLASSERKETAAAKTGKTKTTGDEADEAGGQKTKSKRGKGKKEKPTSTATVVSSSEDEPIANTRPRRQPTMPSPPPAPIRIVTDGILDRIAQLREGGPSQETPQKGLVSEGKIMVNGKLVSVPKAPTVSPLSNPPEPQDVDMEDNEHV